MRKIERALFSVFAVALVFVMAGAASVLAQDQAEPAGQPSSIQGELIEVDTENQMLVVRTEAEAPMRFQYNDQTEIAGAQENIAGLATARDSRVTVTFTEEAGVRTATKVEVHGEE